MKLFSAMQIANWFVEQSLKDPFSLPQLTPSKLQNLLYYAQCHYLAKTGVVLFQDDIEAWECGPVIPAVKRAYLNFEEAVIDRVDPDLHLTPTGKAKETLEEVLQAEAQKAPDELVEMIHQQAPWKEAYQPSKNNTVSILLMKQVFPRQRETEEWVDITNEEAEKAYERFYVEDKEVLNALAK